MKYFLIIPLILVIFLSGCTTGQFISFQYKEGWLCPDGEEVNNPDLCVKPTFTKENLEVTGHSYSNEQLCETCLETGRHCNHVLSMNYQLAGMQDFDIDKIRCTLFFDGKESNHQHITLFGREFFIMTSTPQYIDMTQGRDVPYCCSLQYSVKNQATGESIPSYTEEVCTAYYTPPVCSQPEVLEAADQGSNSGGSGCGCGK